MPISRDMAIFVLTTTTTTTQPITLPLAHARGVKIVKSTLSVHSTNAIQTASVTIISYKPLSELNFARYTIMYGSYMPSPPLGSISPW